MFNQELINRILLNRTDINSNKLLIISGYATHNMASWHLKKINELKHHIKEIELIVGMTNLDGLTKDIHDGFKQLSETEDYPLLQCKYIIEGFPVHSKLYIWLNNNNPTFAFTGSANYTQAGFSVGRREYMVECDPLKAYEYYCSIERNSMYCTHSEIEQYICLRRSHAQLEIESIEGSTSFDETIPKCTLSLLSKDGTIGARSGLNWGQRPNREPNQAYIPVPVGVARSGFFPTDKQHFSVRTDDNKLLILRLEQQNDKAITTPLNNSLLGEYIRNRLGLSNGAFVSKNDLQNYGRTDITFYKIDNEEFYMDFSVNSI